MNESVTFRPGQPGDEPLILRFIHLLAEYEHMQDQVVANEALLTEWLFEKQKAEVIFAIADGREVGIALFFHNFSTFLGRAGLYLEDLFVLKEYRGRGYGKALLRELARIALDRDVYKRQELLDTLAEDGDFDRATRQMDALESKRSILSRLLTCFPGYYGQYLSLHFGAFLGEPITTQAQQDAFSTVIAFLDSVELKLPQDLREMLEEASQGMDDAFLSIQAAHMRQLAKDPAQYLDDHRPSLEAYMEYLRAADYHASPVYQLRQALIDFSRQSGYESVFLPEMCIRDRPTATGNTRCCSTIAGSPSTS